MSYDFAHISPGAAQDRKTAKPVILVCMSNEADFRQLSNRMSDNYLVVQSNRGLESIRFDLCLADRSYLQENLGAVRRCRESSAPAFLPFVLLEHDTSWLGHDDPVMSLVADVVPVPVSPTILRSRLDTLLQTRSYSLQLVRQNRKLNEERSFINRAIQSLPGLFYVMDDNLNMVRWNENLERELGYGGEELRQMKPTDFVQPGEGPRVRAALQRAIEHGSAELELNLRSSRGDFMPYFVTGKVFERNGERFLVGTCTNLTDLRDAESERDRQASLLQNLFEHSPTAIALLDDEERVVSVNRRFQSMFGYTESEAKGRIINELITPEGEEVDQHELLEHHEQTGDKMQFESMRRHKDGSPVPVLIGAVPIRNGDTSESLGSYVLYTDMSLQKATEEKLSDSRQRWESLVNNDPDLIQITRPDGIILYINPAGARFFAAWTTRKN